MLAWLAMNLSTAFKQQNESNHTGTPADKARTGTSHSPLDFVRRAGFDSDLHCARMRVAAGLHLPGRNSC